jgi:hypothetical protein
MLLILLLSVTTVGLVSATSPFYDGNHIYLGDWYLQPFVACSIYNTLVPSTVNVTILSNNLISMPDYPLPLSAFLNQSSIAFDPTAVYGVAVNGMAFNWGVWAEEYAEVVKTLGYNALIIYEGGDDSWAAWIALRFFKTVKCPIPFYVIGRDDLTVLPKASFVNIRDQITSETVFTSGPVVILGITVPTVIFTLFCLISACRKLYRNGFPFVINTGTFVCILAICQCPFFCKFSNWDTTIDIFFSVIIASFVQSSSPMLNWPMIQLICVLVASLSALMGFSISLQFHVSQVAVRERQGFVCTPSIIIATTLTLSYIVCFSVSSYLFVSPMRDDDKVAWGVMAVATFLAFRIWLSAYFFWAQYTTMNSFKRTASTIEVKQRSKVKRLGTKLGITSIVNLCGIVQTSLLSTSVFSHNHGWVILPALAVVLSLEACLQVAIVHSTNPRNVTMENIRKGRKPHASPVVENEERRTPSRIQIMNKTSTSRLSRSKEPSEFQEPLLETSRPRSISKSPEPSKTISRDQILQSSYSGRLQASSSSMLPNSPVLSLRPASPTLSDSP